MKKNLAILSLLFTIGLFSCDGNKPSPPASDSDSTHYFSYEELRSTLQTAQSIIANPSRVDIKSVDNALLIQKLNQISEILDGLEVQANRGHHTGRPITTNEFDSSVNRMRRKPGLGLLYWHGNIHAFEIGKSDIDSITKGYSNYHSIRAYPLLHKDGTSLSYAFVLVKDSTKIEKVEMRDFFLSEATDNMWDTWDPWPPRLKGEVPQKIKDSTLVKYYYKPLIK